jgi:hypothetical protein
MAQWERFFRHATSEIAEDRQASGDLAPVFPAP